jgi:hypothetical protein
VTCVTAWPRGRGLPEEGKKQIREGGLILFDMQHRKNKREFLI